MQTITKHYTSIEVERSYGSNWLLEDDIFSCIIPRECFIANVCLDNEPGTGYGWSEISGAKTFSKGVIGTTTKKRRKGYTYIEGTITADMLRERELDEHWRKTGTCTHGDMNYKRHVGPKEYRHDVPCGTICKTCGTFWVD